jgi:arylsulfatase A-like enzyme
MKAGLSLNGALRGGKHTEWEGGFREPFIVRWPGHVPAGTVSEQVICLTDLLATLAGVRHAPLSRGQAEDSFNLLRAFTEAKPGAPVRDSVILQSADATYDVRQGDWKFIERTDAPAFATVRNKSTLDAAAHKKAAGLSTDELYQLAADPAETTDVRAAHLERAATLKKLLITARDRGFTRPYAGP